MLTTSHLTKTPTNRASVRGGDIIDGARVEAIRYGQLKGVEQVALKFEGEEYGPYLPADWHISVYR